MRIRLLWGLLLGLFIQFPSSRAMPFEPLAHPKHRLTYNLLLAGRYNALGALFEPELRYRFRLHNSGIPLKREAHLGIAFVSSSTPAVSRMGAMLIVKPFTVLELKAGYFFNSWYGTFGHVQSFEHVEDDYYISDKFSEDKGPHDSAVGHEAYLRLQLLAAFGPFAFSTATSGIYTALSLKGDGSLFFHALYNILMPNNGWIMTNDTDLVFISPFKLIIGLRCSMVHAFYRDEHFLEGKRQKNSATPVLSLGPLGAYTFYDHPGALINKPTIVIMLLWWLRHPYRTGQEMAWGVPSISLVFRMEGDIWSRE